MSIKEKTNLFDIKQTFQLPGYGKTLIGRQRLAEAFRKRLIGCWLDNDIYQQGITRYASCSRTTLYKHLDIWRQQYEDLAAGLFAMCTGEYNAVEGAATSESKLLLPLEKEKVPPGLLAARQMVYEETKRAASKNRRFCELQGQR